MRIAPSCFGGPSSRSPGSTRKPKASISSSGQPPKPNECGQPSRLIPERACRLGRFVAGSGTPRPFAPPWRLPGSRRFRHRRRPSCPGGGMVGASQRDGVGGEAEGLGAVAEVVVGLGGQEPSEVVKGFQPVGLEAQRL